MSNYTDKIKKLRHSTGVGFKDCSSAINESRGDIDKAIEILRIKGISKASKKMSRDAKEGLVAISGDKNKISTIEVNCETDFVAKNDEFINFAKELSELNLNNNANVEKLKNAVMKNDKTVKENLINFISKIGEKITIGRTKIFNSHGTKNYSYSHTIVKDNLSKLAVIVSLESSISSNDLDKFGKKLAMHIAASNPLVIDSDLINKEILNNEEKLISEELKNTGKPDEIIKKIVIGKINKFKEENSLLTQFWVMDPKKKVKDIINELGISDLKIKDFYRIKIGE